MQTSSRTPSGMEGREHRCWFKTTGNEGAGSRSCFRRSDKLFPSPVHVAETRNQPLREKQRADVSTGLSTWVLGGRYGLLPFWGRLRGQEPGAPQDPPAEWDPGRVAQTPAASLETLLGKSKQTQPRKLAFRLWGTACHHPAPSSLRVRLYGPARRRICWPRATHAQVDRAQVSQTVLLLWNLSFLEKKASLPLSPSTSLSTKPFKKGFSFPF